MPSACASAAESWQDPVDEQQEPAAVVSSISMPAFVSAVMAFSVSVVRRTRGCVRTDMVRQGVRWMSHPPAP
ncbi:hypothetical protein GCM10010271_19220 [Streptomyces kurssanovii]|nr:hypothetical protein GCM10010271_19220 [Streptomyces kurssanovii]